MKKHFIRSLEAALDKTVTARNVADYEYTVYRLMCQHLEENGVEIPNLACLPEIVETMFAQYNQIKKSVNQPDLTREKSRRFCHALENLAKEFEAVSNFSIEARQQLHQAWLEKFPQTEAIL